MHSNGWLKLLLIAAMGVVLLFPLAKITGLIAERELRQREAVAEVRQLWGGAQVVGGPVLTVPFERSIPGSGKPGAGEGSADAVPEGRGFFLRTEFFHLLPEELEIDVEIDPSVRRRGNFEVVVYTARLSLSGSFRAPARDRRPAGEDAIRWDEASLRFDLSELRGLRENPGLAWRGEALELEPRPGTLLGESVVVPRFDASALESGDPGDFELTLLLSGSGSLDFLPLGRETRVTVVSPWPDPSFRGAALPVAREVGPEGFTARWSVPYFARSYPQSWATAAAVDEELRRTIAASAAGVELLVPVDFYQQVSRCTKYALLFLGLTFGSFFLFELLAGLRIHPLQYLMVGFAMSLFYLLLLAVAEHVGFGAAYLMASVATVALISGYCLRVLATRGRALLLAAALGGLYGLLYVLVQLQTYALLVGSVGLFVALALTMYLTRHVDWYELGSLNVFAVQGSADSADAADPGDEVVLGREA